MVDFINTTILFLELFTELISKTTLLIKAIIILIFMTKALFTLIKKK